MPIQADTAAAGSTEQSTEHRIAKLEKAMMECSSRLGGLSMGLVGSPRAQVCIANNYLLRALGRTEHFVADNWNDDFSDVDPSKESV